MYHVHVSIISITSAFLYTLLMSIEGEYYIFGLLSAQ